MRGLILLLLVLTYIDSDASKPFRNGTVVYFQEDSILISNGTACPAVKEGRLPNIILQVGDMRTASTLQYTTLLLLGQLQCSGSVIKRGFVHHTRDIRDVLAEQRDPNVLQIYKSHTFPHIESLPKNAWIFVSVSGESNATKIVSDIKRKYHRDVQNLQSFNEVKHNKVGNLSSYHQWFRFSAFPLNFLTSTLELWRTIRICCGSQMSAPWRKVLMHPAALFGSRRQQRWLSDQIRVQTNASLPPKHTCSYVDFNEIETKLFEMLRYKNISLSILPLGSHSPIEHYIGWCECTVQLTHRLHLDMNNFQYKRCERKQHNFLRKAPKGVGNLILKYENSRRSQSR